MRGHPDNAKDFVAAMEALPPTAWVLLAALAVIQAILSGAQAYEHRRSARNRLHSALRSRPKGRVVLFVPCRGCDIGLEENLAAILQQDYVHCEIRFLVESPEDPACRIIRRVVARHPRKCRILFTGRATNCGQKVHNLIQGTSNLPANVEFLAFADSDARPRPEWLRALLSRLKRDEVGAATGYRWFVPAQASLSNLLVTSINASMGMFLGKRNPNIVWGGSWAIRRRRFEDLQIRREWRGKLNDDLVVTSVLRRHGLRIDYEPACAVASPLDVDFRRMVDFGRRQYLQGRYYLPRCWLIGLILTTYSLGAFLTAIAAAALMIVRGNPGAWLPVAVAATIYTGWVFRGVHRVWLAAQLFPEHHGNLQPVRLLELAGGPLTALINWLIFASTIFGRGVVWRGIRYRLDRRGNVLEVHHLDDQGPRAAGNAGGEHGSDLRGSSPAGPKPFESALHTAGRTKPPESLIPAQPSRSRRRDKVSPASPKRRMHWGAENSGLSTPE